MKTYNELINIYGYDNRLSYLKTNNIVGEETLGSYRNMCQIFYRSSEWKKIRDKVIIRDRGCDMALEYPDYEIQGTIIVHHINPITVEDLMHRSFKLYDLNNLVCVSFDTHQKITYVESSIKNDVPKLVLERSKNDTILW